MTEHSEGADPAGEPLDFSDVLASLVDLIGEQIDVAVRAQGATIIDEVMSATGTLLEGVEPLEALRHADPGLLDERIRFAVGSQAEFWLSRADFIEARRWGPNPDVPAGAVLLVTLIGCELRFAPALKTPRPSPATAAASARPARTTAREGHRPPA